MRKREKEIMYRNMYCAAKRACKEWRRKHRNKKRIKRLVNVNYDYIIYNGFYMTKEEYYDYCKRIQKARIQKYYDDLAKAPQAGLLVFRSKITTSTSTSTTGDNSCWTFKTTP